MRSNQQRPHDRWQLIRQILVKASSYFREGVICCSGCSENWRWLVVYELAVILKLVSSLTKCFLDIRLATQKTAQADENRVGTTPKRS